MAQIIHIGYPKTGTTWLQKEFFPRVNQYEKLIKSPILKNIYNPDVSQQNLNKIFKPYTEKTNLIISDEDLVTDKPNHPSPFIKAERIKYLFPDAHIVLFIRNQNDILVSAYDQYIKGGGTLHFKKYIALLIEAGKINHWQYHKIIQKYFSLFGKNNIKIFLFEDFKNNPHFLDEFTDKLHLTLLDSPNIAKKINTRLSNSVRNLWRISNHFTKHQLYSSFPPKNYFFHFPGLFTFNKICFSTLNYFFKQILKVENTNDLNMAIEVNSIFAHSNKILLDITSLNIITKYKYPLK